ncbi:hypothetical protein [Sphaerisporangium sp. TRM90804]|uniref:hypothetical protein n=1 Tax=Sphaerisporangium sp. TRM90804 TaxID=3031113 RepID=UPI00244B95AB|nr:hypothetical protein [Sphaerisporangium sp. TRM90804]MDH2425787.1 hypothetical protein [Sphaerisporangium sp. TRM90804]
MGLRERLDGKERPTLPYKVRVQDTTAAEAALGEAQAELLMALGTEREATAQEAVKAALAALEECFEPIIFTAMDPEEFEVLVAQHAPRPDTEDEAWNVDTLPRETFLRCAPPVYTPEEWLEWITRTCNRTERVELFNAAVAVNVRTVSPTLPKGWTEILDSL